MRERDIENYLVRRVKEAGGEVRKVSWIGRRGAPDRVVMRDGTRAAVNRLMLAGVIGPLPRLIGLVQDIIADHILWPELKAPGVEPEPHQLREHERMRRLGQRVVVIDSFQQVDELLK